jgi:hypothetical protein
VTREYETTSASYCNGNYPPAPEPPKGEGWTLKAMAAIPWYDGATLFWSWERDVPDDPDNQATVSLIG